MPNSENNKPWKYLKDRFGIKKSETDFKIKKNSGDYWITSKNQETDLEIETYGIRFIRDSQRGLKPTTYGLQIIEDKITKNIVKVNKEELLKLLRREEMIPREIQEEGYIALKYQDRVIGCGFYKNKKVSSRIPKGRGKELANSMQDETN